MSVGFQNSIREHFPALISLDERKITYLDNAATTQKPLSVIDSLTDFYKSGYGNINRSSHPLGQATSQLWEASRDKIKTFIGCPASHELILTHGATEASNLIATGLSSTLGPKCTVAVGLHDHHAQFVPWQQACKKTGASFVVYEIDATGELDADSFDKILSLHPSVVCFTEVSHVTGTVLPIKELTRKAHEVGAIVVVDGSQAVSHSGINISDLNPDFYFFSSHKLYGPTGIGALCGRNDLLQKMTPLVYGGDMVSTVTIEETDFSTIPRKFEGGTQPLAEGVAFAAACEFLLTPHARAARNDETALTKMLLEGLLEIPEITIFGSCIASQNRRGIISFSFKDLHSHDVGEVFARRGICARSGHHCAQPFMRAHGVGALTRLSLGIYSNKQDVTTVLSVLNELAAYTRKKIGVAA